MNEISVFVFNVKHVGFVFATNSKLCKKPSLSFRRLGCEILAITMLAMLGLALTNYNRLAAARHQLSDNINHKLLFCPNQRIFFVGESAIGLHIRLWGSYEILNYGQNVSQPVSFARSSWGRLMVNEAIFKQP